MAALKKVRKGRFSPGLLLAVTVCLALAATSRMRMETVLRIVRTLSYVQIVGMVNVETVRINATAPEIVSS